MLIGWLSECGRRMQKGYINEEGKQKWQQLQAWVYTNEIKEYLLDGNNPAFVDIPIWFVHNITNIGNTNLITLFWTNEFYNSSDSDTYFEKV